MNIENTLNQGINILKANNIPNPHLDSLYADFAQLIGEEGLNNEELNAKARELAQDKIEEAA